MSRHVDVVKNEPLSGLQQRVATLAADGNGVRVEPEAWIERIEQLAGPMNGHAPGEYLSLVVERLADATYMSATESHDDLNCPFAKSDVIPMDAEHAREPAEA